MAENLRSRIVTQGVQRSPNRAMLRAVGFGDDDFEKAIVGVANGYSTITPCNLGLDILAKRADAAVKSAGAMPQMFGTITVSDGISMGTEGMKYSLVSREVIADSIETAVNAESMDGVVVVGGCDKNMPGAMIAIARMNIPSIFVYGGTIKPGHLNGRDLTIVSSFEAVGQFSAHKIDEKELMDVERRACPGAGSCGGMYTANTMSSAIEAMGMSLPFSSTMAAEDAEKADSAAKSAEAVVKAIHHATAPAPDHDAQGLRECDRGRDGGRRLDQRGAASARDRARRRGPAHDRRLRNHPPAHSGAVRPEAVGTVCRHRPASRRRHPASDEDAARPRPAARRRDDHHRPHRRAKPRRNPRRAVEGSRRHSSMGLADVRAGPSRDPQGQPRARGLRR